MFRSIARGASRDVVVWRSDVVAPRMPGRRARGVAVRIGLRATCGSSASIRVARARVQSRIRGRLGRAHDVRRRLSDSRHRRGIARRLNERLAARGHASALPMNRFRPNVVIDGSAAARRGSRRYAHVRRGDAAPRQAVHALPGHDDRPGDRARRHRAAAHARSTIRMDETLDGVTFGDERDRRRGRR